jgi:hypothetical protein
MRPAESAILFRAWPLVENIREAVASNDILYYGLRRRGSRM